jgi:galactofuranosylgalactofuranosylrhamnosyl-N-acetylglucosaminyl-diphospho-decaprenol beta-1,5/1,6-galactofuranosyltransferase
VDSKSAVAGAMFYTDRPTVQHEKGAFFTRKHTDKKILTALSHNTDLAQRVSVANNDLPDKANYGGWWFFMFPISEVTFWPFPFFVRGDDTDFSLSNQFHIVTLNGICSWSENFIHKITPSISYLAYRSWLALSFMHNTHAHIRFSFRILLRTALSFGIKHHYGSMHAVLNAGFDALKGPSYFAEHPNPLTRIAEFKPYDQSYQASPSDIASMAITQQKNTISHKWLRIFSPNALFLPSCSIAKQPVHTDFYAKKSHRLCLNKATYGFGEGDRIRFYPKSFRVFIKELKRLLILFFVFYKEYKKTFAVYQRDTKIYKTRSYWEKFYQTTNAADKISQKIQ